MKQSKVGAIQERNQHRWLFSLTELLIVVAIFAVLLSLLSPSLKKALDSASAVQCLSHLKSIALAQAAYADDHADCLPNPMSIYATRPEGGDTDGVTWSYYLTSHPYTNGYPNVGGDYMRANDRFMLSCPLSTTADSLKKQESVGPRQTYGMLGIKRTGYDIERSYKMPAGTLTVYDINGIPEPGQWGMLFDVSYEEYNRKDYFSVKRVVSRTAEGRQAGVFMAHGEYCNVTFYDASARSLDIVDLAALKNLDNLKQQGIGEVLVEEDDAMIRVQLTP